MRSEAACGSGHASAALRQARLRCANTLDIEFGETPVGLPGHVQARRLIVEQRDVEAPDGDLERDLLSQGSPDDHRNLANGEARGGGGEGTNAGSRQGAPAITKSICDFEPN